MALFEGEDQSRQIVLRARHAVGEKSASNDLPGFVPDYLIPWRIDARFSVTNNSQRLFSFDVH